MTAIRKDLDEPFVTIFVALSMVMEGIKPKKRQETIDRMRLEFRAAPNPTPARKRAVEYMQIFSLMHVYNEIIAISQSNQSRDGRRFADG